MSLTSTAPHFFISANRPYRSPNSNDRKTYAYQHWKFSGKRICGKHDLRLNTLVGRCAKQGRNHLILANRPLPPLQRRMDKRLVNSAWEPRRHFTLEEYASDSRDQTVPSRGNVMDHLRNSSAPHDVCLDSAIEGRLISAIEISYLCGMRPLAL
jgi:hypothetical protein